MAACAAIRYARVVRFDPAATPHAFCPVIAFGLGIKKEVAVSHAFGVSDLAG